MRIILPIGLKNQLIGKLLSPSAPPQICPFLLDRFWGLEEEEEEKEVSRLECGQAFPEPGRD